MESVRSTYPAALGLLLCCFLCGSNSLRLCAQDSLTVVATIHEAPLEVGKVYRLGADTYVRIDRLRWYLGDLAAGDTCTSTGPPATRYHLLDLEQPHTMRLPRNVRDGSEALSLRFGIDSLTNHLGVHPGPLDPSKGMYWSWQSGYIDFKLEGVRWLGEPSDTTAGTGFTYHLGGFQQGVAPSHTFTVSAAQAAAQPAALRFEFAPALQLAFAELGNHLMRSLPAGQVLAKAVTQHATLR